MKYLDEKRLELRGRNRFLLLIFFVFFLYPNTSTSQIQINDLAEVESDVVATNQARGPKVKNSVEFRVPDKKKIEKYASQSRFQYVEEVAKPTKSSEPSGLVKFLGEMIASIARMFASPIFMWIMIIFAIGVIVYLIAKYANIDLRAIMRGKVKKASNLNMVISEDDVEETEYSGLIRDAIANKEYRLAIRYLYLQNLKVLAAKKIIIWKPNKTNHSYVNEIQDMGLKGDFRDSTLIFDYVWYGEIEVNETNFSSIRSRLDDIYKLVGNHAE